MSSENGALPSENGVMSSEQGLMSSGEEGEDSEWIDGVRGLQELSQSAEDNERETTGVTRSPRELCPRTTNESVASGQVISLSPGNSLLWEGVGKAPCAMRRGTATVAGGTMYVNSCDSREVYGYRDVTTATMTRSGERREARGQWFRLADYPVKFFSLVQVDSKITGVGGVSDGLLKKKCSNQLLCLEGGGEGGRWVRGFPSMPTARGFTGVIATATHLVVAGGGSMESKLSTVEVLDVDNSQWATAAPLPQPLTSISMALLDGQLYLGGFFTQKRDGVEDSLLASQSVLTCSLDTLLSPGITSGNVVSGGGEGFDKKVALNGGVGGASNKRGVASSEASGEKGGVVSVGGASSEQGGGASNVGEVRGEVTGDTRIWRNVKDLTTACSTLVAHGNRLVAVGGVLLSGPYSSQLYGYDPEADSWSVVGRLGVQRSLPLVAVVPDNRLVVVGGLMPDYSWGGTNRSDGFEVFSAAL